MNRAPTFALLGFFSIQEVLYLLEHGFDVTKGTVYTGEADIGNLVHAPQVFHHQFTNNAALHFLPAQAVQFLLDLFDRAFDFTYGKWPLFARLANTNSQLFPIKGFAPLVTFDDHQVGFLNALICAETPLALFTFSSAMDSISNVA